MFSCRNNLTQSTRLIEGIGVTLVLSASAVVVAATVSTVVGMIAGYLGGWVKELTLRLADVFYAFPSIILAILLAAVLGAGGTCQPFWVTC